jgi:hypothetical protein
VLFFTGQAACSGRTDYHDPATSENVTHFQALNLAVCCTLGSMLVQRLGGGVYSSKFAFSVPRSLRTLEEAAPDSVLAVEHGGMIHTKGITGRSYIEKTEIYMEWCPCEGIDIITRIANIRLTL